VKQGPGEMATGPGQGHAEDPEQNEVGHLVVDWEPYRGVVPALSIARSRRLFCAEATLHPNIRTQSLIDACSHWTMKRPVISQKMGFSPPTGVYGDLIHFTQAFFKGEGYRTMKVSTQIQNHAVQKVWSRESFVLRESLNTIHINSFLSYSRLEKHSFELRILPEDVESFGQASGDYNPLHFNDAFAQARGFEKRVAHGLIANSVLSKYFGTEFPGPGTLFMSFCYKFFRPLYLDTPYRVMVSIPYSVEKKGIYYAVAKVCDAQDNLCLVSYSDLIRPKE
jgi:hypothetical protein